MNMHLEQALQHAQVWRGDQLGVNLFVKKSIFCLAPTLVHHHRSVLEELCAIRQLFSSCGLIHRFLHRFLKSTAIEGPQSL